MSRRQKDIKELKIGYIFLAILSILQPFITYAITYAETYSKISAYVSAALTIIAVIILLIIQYIPYKKFQRENSKNTVIFGIVISLINTVVVSPLGGIPNLIVYIRLLRGAKA